MKPRTLPTIYDLSPSEKLQLVEDLCSSLLMSATVIKKTALPGRALKQI